MGWLDDLKPGDEVAYHRDRRPTFARVTKRTEHRIALDNGDVFDGEGNARGPQADFVFLGRWSLMQPDQMRRILWRERIRGTRWDDLPSSKLERIVAILDEKEPV